MYRRRCCTEEIFKIYCSLGALSWLKTIKGDRHVFTCTPFGENNNNNRSSLGFRENARACTEQRKHACRAFPGTAKQSGRNEQIQKVVPQNVFTFDTRIA